MVHVGRGRRGAWIVVVALGLIVGGCGDSVEVESPGTSSSPIIAEVPDDWQLVSARERTGRPTWGEDCCGSTEPYTIIQRLDDGRTIKVSATGYAGYQGGLEQASGGYTGDITEFEVNGQRALLASGGAPGLVELVVEVNDTTAIRVAGVDATRDELVETASSAAVGDDHRIAPRMERLPEGFELVGSVHTPAIESLLGDVVVESDVEGNDGRTHDLGWTIGPANETPSQATVSLSALPANTIDLAALALGEDLPFDADGRLDTDGAIVKAERTEVAGRPALVIERLGFEWWEQRTVITTSAWGDQLIAVGIDNSETQDQLPSTDQLNEVIASAAVTDAETWGELVVEESDGPGLTPDVGQEEVVRGEVGGLEWLLQTGNDGGFSSSTIQPFGVDPCIKVSDESGGCPSGASMSPGPAGGGGTAVAVGALGPDKYAFVGVVVSDDDPTVTLRLTRPDGATEVADFRPVPGAATRAAVLVVDEPGQFQCEGAGVGLASDASGPTIGRIELLDDGDNSLGCLEN